MNDQSQLFFLSHLAPVDNNNHIETKKKQKLVDMNKWY